jgi:hypothetical protein
MLFTIEAKNSYSSPDCSGIPRFFWERGYSGKREKPSFENKNACCLSIIGFVFAFVVFLPMPDGQLM